MTVTVEFSIDMKLRDVLPSELENWYISAENLEVSQCEKTQAHAMRNIN